MVKWLQRVLLLVMLAVWAVNALFAFLVYDYNRTGLLTEEKTLVFARKQGFRAMVDQLETEGVIRNGLAVKLIAFGLKKAHRFKAGEYAFPAGISAHQVVDMIVSGKVVQRKVTLPEGLTSREALAILAREQGLTGELPQSVPEGSLLPETYLFTYGDDRQSVLRQMQDGMQKLLTRLWQERQDGLPLKNMQEALVLASIVEKETGLAQERPLVASVFINRLNKSMRLQSDPTVAYGLMGNAPSPKRVLTGEDLKSQTAYNTYVIDRLPPSPIANPGKASLQAVLNPPATNYLYFVATGTGGHRFAASLDEHNHNVRLYREALRKAP